MRHINPGCGDTELHTPLNDTEARVIGCLIEKSVVTPDQYPLTLNALTNACNQKSSRNPVMSLSQGEVQHAIRELESRHLVRTDENFKSRVEKYAQRFCNTRYSNLQFSDAELAIVCLLLLRGPQTPGELRSRSGRLHAFADNAAVVEALVDFEVAEVTAAATFYLAEIYFEFSAALLDSERPAGLSEAEKVDYEMVIEEEAYPFEEQAIAVHEENFELLAAGVYNPWVQKSLDKLAVLMPGRYAKQETSEGFIGTVEVYAYRMPIAPPEPVEGEDGPGVSDASQAEADRRVVVSSNAEGSK